jgi:hypothetical protein
MCVAVLQTGLHEQYGGVKPDVARDAHAAAITSTVQSCLEEAGVTAADLTAVAVTIGPGLSLCLQVGARGERGARPGGGVGEEGKGVDGEGARHSWGRGHRFGRVGVRIGVGWWCPSLALGKLGCSG